MKIRLGNLVRIQQINNNSKQTQEVQTLNEFIDIFKDITIKNSFHQRYDKITVNACHKEKIGTTFNTRGCGAGESLVSGVRRN